MRVTLRLSPSRRNCARRELFVRAVVPIRASALLPLPLAGRSGKGAAAACHDRAAGEGARAVRYACGAWGPEFPAARPFPLPNPPPQAGEGAARGFLTNAAGACAPGGQDKGILPDRMIHALLETGAIIPEVEPDEDQVQPASIDLRLGEVAYRVRASFLPGTGATVAERIDELKLHDIPLGDGAVLETG